MHPCISANKKKYCQNFKHYRNRVIKCTGYHAGSTLSTIEKFLCLNGLYKCTVLYCMSNTMFGSNNFGGSRNFGGPRDSGPREMTKVTCSDCGKECEVPFKPTEGRPVYCRECLPCLLYTSPSPRDRQ